MKDRYRRFSFISDVGGMKSALGEMRGLGHPPQPRLSVSKTPVSGDDFDEAWFWRTITEKIAGHPENCLEYPYYGGKIFEAPLVGFVRGDDPIFETFKTVIGPHHFTPEEIMAWQAGKNGVPSPPPEEISVVSIILPIVPATRRRNAQRLTWPSERWAQTRLLGELFSQVMVREMVTHLMAHGILAVAPDVTPLFRKKRYPGVGWASPWSHRHLAYAAGLGTFGIHDFLITEKGCAHRAASFVVHRRLAPDRKRPDDIHAHCLTYQGKECLQCARRCPVDAISRTGAHDKEKCYRHVARSLRYCNSNYHIFIYGCGLCATGVPCESRVPEKIREKEKA